MIDFNSYHFHPSEYYPEIRDFFGPHTVVKAIAAGDGHYWYVAIKIRNPSHNDDRYEVYGGTFTKDKAIERREWPRTEFLGLISTPSFAEELLKHLMGTLKNDNVQTVGKERLEAKCLYIG